MIKSFFSCFVVAVASNVGTINHTNGNDSYILDRVVEVAGRQGIACDGKYYYVSDTGALYKYDLDWNLVKSNNNPFEHPDVANHFGDIDVADGEIYCGIISVH